MSFLVVNESISDAIHQFFYDILVHSLAYFLAGIDKAINWLAGANLVELIFGKNGTQLTPPKIFMIFAGIGIILLICLIGVSIVKSLSQGSSKQTLSYGAKNICLFILFIAIIPIAFFMINFIVGIIFKAIFSHIATGNNLASLVAGLGFYNNTIPSGWDYNQYPPVWANYSITLASLSLIVCCGIFFLLSFQLIKRLFVIFTCYVISPLIATKSLSVNNYLPLITLKEVLVGAFLSSVAIIICFNIFSLLTPSLLALASESKLTGSGLKALKIIIIIGSALAVKQVSNEVQNYFITGISLTDGASIVKQGIDKTKATGKFGAIKSIGGAKWSGSKAINFSAKKSVVKMYENQTDALISGIQSIPGSAIPKIPKAIKKTNYYKKGNK